MTVSKEEVKTAPLDPRFAFQNQARHCFWSYSEFQRCVKKTGDAAAPECAEFAKVYRSLCPSEWVNKWNEQVEKGAFPLVDLEKKPAHH
ncbi:mitochondrial Complex IV (CIV) cytochrome c:O2 oxidoreductase subunit 6b (Cox6b/Cox12) [Andalucia godoyi]|uniref:Mitochondrial Complex IV (CIV) cytochrome c:O2 oxidoreductase subunit 6b (Cox6b/Cox12) n=1 Tax=Andalucia godoyi TaxID=505711 RepID=A0A8K0AHY2_ANDGO|nr:mitochondrial Complex IV (CIV) cytochrome c:O2 oxidoreductase subunit 6b (Cox6b/Cox12) [Andalucia godoyi]|eukprot:ANDGO_02666.mRNA.1 mitochondrial Complex IV (CIV) cytochrome c:O2 oxidoreductase subunit 6b (Cox6b/Cox12)